MCKIVCCSFVWLTIQVPGSRHLIPMLSGLVIYNIYNRGGLDGRASFDDDGVDVFLKGGNFCHL